MRFLHERRLDPLLLNSPLRQKPVALAVALVLLLILTSVVMIFLRFFGGLRPDIAMVFFGALALSSLMSVAPLVILWFLDRRERETPWLFGVAFLWGAFFAIGLAVLLNKAIMYSVAQWLARNPVLGVALGPDEIAGPIVEELTKGLGVLVLFFFLRAEFDNMRDGLVYGALIGAGFNWLEAPLYVAQGYEEFGVAPWGRELGLRYALFGLAGHAMFSALFGASLGLALQTRRRWLKLVAPVVGLSLAILAHAYNNVLPLLVVIAITSEIDLAWLSGSLAQHTILVPFTMGELGLIERWLRGSLAHLTIFLPFILITAVVIWRSGTWERRVLREELAEEVGRSVSPDEYREILRDRVLRTRRIDSRHPDLSAAIVNAQHELGFRKRRVRDEGRDPERDPLVSVWREEIRLLQTIA